MSNSPSGNSRRFFLKSCGVAMFGAGAVPGWLARAADQAPSQGGSKKVLVTLFQRGAADGLNIVAPFGDRNYASLRPTIALPAPSASAASGEALLDLNGFFGLHPALAPLKPLFEQQQLAIIHAAGSPDPTRSHFDAQDYMESGTPGRKATSDGWLNRALLPTGTAAASSLRAVGIGPELPRALRGRNTAVAVNNLSEFKVRDAESSSAFQSMYAGTLDKRLNTTASDTFEAVKLVERLQAERYTPANGAKYPTARIGQALQQIARLIKADLGLQVAFADMGGWDTHVNQLGATPTTGTLANLLGDFAKAIAAFHQDLGDRMQDVALVTMSEFGRTAKENGTRGTDHGHANVMFALGANVQGGKIYGDWPGLAPDQLYEGRDLKVTTDFRDVLGEFVAKHLGNNQLAQVFPGYAKPRFRDLLGA
jgi:uncharacterized protein (DUF1501 family)